MLVRSNIGQVILRLKRLEDELPQCLSRAAAPGYWKPRLEAVATKTLRAQWVNERNVKLHEFYERLTPQIVATLLAETFEGGTFFGLRLPGQAQEPMNLEAAALFNLGQKTPTGRMKKAVVDQGVFNPELADQASLENLERVREVVRDWVMIEKHLGPQDYHPDGTPLSPEELTDRIELILGISRGAVPRERTAAMEDAAQKLAGAIQRWLDGEGENPAPNYGAGSETPWNGAGGLPPGGQPTSERMRLSAEVALEWLTAVLAAWRSVLLASLPMRAQMEIEKLFGKVRQEML